MKLRLLFILLGICNCLLYGQINKNESKNKNIKILLISDLNDSYGSVTYSKEVHDVVSRIKSIKPDIILCGGDMVAGQKASLSPARLDSMWMGFDQAIFQPIAKLGIPFGFTMGNHDASPNYHNDRVASAAFWKKNKHKTQLSFVDDSHFPYYFSYIKNNIFFISWDASSAHIPQNIKEWMKDQLISSKAKKARVRIVLGHLPLYAIVESKNKAGEVLNNADETLDFLKENNVDMYISGHQHAYYPATKNDFTLLHAGCLGGGPRQILGHYMSPTKAYAVLNIPKKSSISDLIIDAYEPIHHKNILLEALPKSVTGFNGTIEKWQVKKIK